MTDGPAMSDRDPDVGCDELVRVGADWERAIEAIHTAPGAVLVLGSPDCGKTTWVGEAARCLSRAGVLPLAILDADIGQSVIGPPASVALALLREPAGEGFSLRALPTEGLIFVGAVSPVGHLLQLLVATARLAERAKRVGARTVLVDTTGLVTPGIGFQLKLRKIELLEPSHLVALQRGGELEALLSVVCGRPGLRLHRLAVTPKARVRTPAERAAYRESRFADYFKGAGRLSLPTERLRILRAPSGGGRLVGAPDVDVFTGAELRDSGIAPGLLLGLNTAADETVGLGLLEEIGADGRELRVRTPVTDASAVRLVQLGSARLQPSGEERRSSG